MTIFSDVIMNIRKGELSAAAERIQRMTGCDRRTAERDVRTVQASLARPHFTIHRDMQNTDITEQAPCVNCGGTGIVVDITLGQVGSRPCPVCFGAGWISGPATLDDVKQALNGGGDDNDEHS